MTNKVQKIREEVERLMTELIQEKEKGFGSDIDDACILELQNVLTFIDSLQEEPASDGLEEAAKEHAVERFRTTRDEFLAEKCKWSFKAGAKWQKEHTINNACVYLNEHREGFIIDDYIKDFRKALENVDA